MGQINIGTDVNSPLLTSPARLNNLTGAYNFSMDDMPGVAAANNFVSLFNPVASGRNLYYLGAYISTYVAGGASTTRESMQGHAITTASAGTLQASSAIFKLDSTFPNAVAEVRTGNPTVTMGPNLFNSPPPINTTTTQYVHAVGLGFGSFGGPVVLRPGEGIVFTTDAGNTSQTWNVSIGWAEAMT